MLLTVPVTMANRAAPSLGVRRAETGKCPPYRGRSWHGPDASVKVWLAYLPQYRSIRACASPATA
jgi:hypothetical protein